jgi:hypothetical protein
MADFSIENAHSMVVGIANYPNVNRLPDAVLNDAKSIHSLLIDPQRCGYKEENSTLLLDDDATKKRLLSELVRLAKRCDQDSTALIYVSSHGGRIGAGAHRGEYLLPFDADPSSEQSLFDTSISGDAFIEALGKIQAGRLIVFLDCCHAGGIGHVKGEGDPSDRLVDAQLPALEKGLSESYYQALKAGKGRAVYSAARAEELSWILGTEKNSLFTKHILAGLHGGVTSVDGLVRIFNLFEYVQPHVTGEMKDQHPVLRFDGEANLPIALYQSGAKGASLAQTSGLPFDAYISFADKEPDYTFVWNEIVPRLNRAGLKVAVANDSEDPRVARVVNMERGITQARNTVQIISKSSLADSENIYRAIMKVNQDMLRGTYSLVLAMIEPDEQPELPAWMPFKPLALAHPNSQRAEREFQRLISALSAPVQTRT